MVHRKKPQLQESEGEGFSDVDSDTSASSNESGLEDPIDDGWVFPILQPKAKRHEYEAVCQVNSSKLILN
jgi:hypothetical protein